MEQTNRPNNRFRSWSLAAAATEDTRGGKTNSHAIELGLVGSLPAKGVTDPRRCGAGGAGLRYPAAVGAGGLRGGGEQPGPGLRTDEFGEGTGGEESGREGDRGEEEWRNDVYVETVEDGEILKPKGSLHQGGMASQSQFSDATPTPKVRNDAAKDQKALHKIFFFAGTALHKIYT